MPNLSYLARLRAATEVARALAFLHGLPPPSGPVVHRDLKPSNILLNPDGIAKVADVGLAFMMSDITSDSDTMEQEPEVRSCMLEKELVGTNGYVDPEYVASGWVGPASDVYGFGVILLQMLTGIRRANPGVVMEIQNLIEVAIDRGSLTKDVVDKNVDDWPEELATSFAHLALNCCEQRRRRRPDLASVVLPELERMLKASEML